MPTPEEIKLVRENVTFIFKSFQRQKMAVSLYRNIQKYYPGTKVIIADDSRKPFPLNDKYLEVIQLPFNSGLSYGLNQALSRVTTPFTVRMDDDELLTPHTGFHEHLAFLLNNKEVDLVGVSYITAPKCSKLRDVAKEYYAQSMSNAPQKLIIPHLTPLGENYVVLGKVPNIFIARTDAYRSVGYDDNIRIIDHNDFFFRAAGNIVSIFAPNFFVYHRHDLFDKNYEKYRSDYKADAEYIKQKYSLK